MADLLSRLICVVVAKSGERELMSVVGHHAGQIVQLAEGVLDKPASLGRLRSLTRLHLFVALVNNLLR